jgi:hypothetical protein
MTKDYSKSLFVVRYVLPSVIVLAGLIAVAISHSAIGVEGGLGIVGAGLATFLFSALARLSMSEDRWRDEEEEARRFFDEHLYWPDEDPSAAVRRRPSLREHSPAKEKRMSSATRPLEIGDGGPARGRR